MDGTLKDITIIRHETLEDCFKDFLGLNDKEYDGLDMNRHRWVGHNGRRRFSVNVGKWLRNNKLDVWGWACYREKTIHVWVGSGCSTESLVGLLAHEAAHLRRPRYKDKDEEEKKAARVAMDAMFAYKSAIDILNNKEN